MSTQLLIKLSRRSLSKWRHNGCESRIYPARPHTLLVFNTFLITGISFTATSKVIYINFLPLYISPTAHLRKLLLLIIIIEVTFHVRCVAIICWYISNHCCMVSIWGDHSVVTHHTLTSLCTLWQELEKL